MNSATVNSLLCKQASYKVAPRTFPERDFSPSACTDETLSLCGIDGTAGMAVDPQNHAHRKKTLQKR